MEYIGDVYVYVDCEGSHQLITDKNVRVVVTKPRNLEHHKMVFACLGYTVNNMKPREGIDSANRLLLAFKDYAGLFDVIPTKNGEIRDYHSISFTSLDETEFKPIAEQIKDFCCLVLGDRPRDITDQLITIMQGKKWRD